MCCGQNHSKHQKTQRVLSSSNQQEKGSVDLPFVCEVLAKVTVMKNEQ